MDTAAELFYRDGVDAVTVERLANEAGVTKPTVYNLFGSKDALVAQAFEHRAQQIRDDIEERIAPFDDPGRKLLELLEVHADMLTSDGFRGCPLVVAAIQAPDSDEATRLAEAHKQWLQTTMSRLARRAGYRSPDTLSWALLFLLEGAAAMSVVTPPSVIVRHARAAGRAILNAHM